ncbi:hypothetical protein Fmac_028324 [Flemingia macrophylla]|uniref:Uncharacterized protein n=1 Tax=Flemingia macrophylla TaxID=520843 RepID=A0ABD1L8L2_9FABA
MLKNEGSKSGSSNEVDKKRDFQGKNFENVEMSCAWGKEAIRGSYMFTMYLYE